MKYVQLGNSNLKVSRVCLGCMGFGEAEKGMHSWTLPEEESKEIIKYALDNGINFFDTAMGYQGGTSEEFLGKAIREYAKREDVVIATKFMPRSMEQIKEGITARQHIETCLNNSLKRLEMDYVDLYILHMWDYNTPVEETMEILHEMIQCGKVKYIGISNCYAWQIAKANEIAKANGWETFISVQNHYNLIFREEEREMA
ncbi:MAG: aldo/keto reductase, partial [Clostridium sp.]|uniref:aldo/keto reductase n=1 Tax=Clostridium sp. TaxID=1506 RepID=UPI00267303D4